MTWARTGHGQRWLRGLRRLAMLAITFMISTLPVRAGETKLKSDEQVVLYPSLAQLVPGTTNRWRTVVRGRVFEAERRRLTVGALLLALDLKDVELTAAEEGKFKERARLFLEDNQRGKKVFIRVADQVVAASKTAANGRFSAEIEFTAPRPTLLPLSSTVALPADDPRQFCGAVYLLPNEGVSVISDIDDTVKLTEVRDQKALLRNTFLRDFRVVPGMAEFYQRLAQSRHAMFHYVSGSPWQLYEPLTEFIATNGLPQGGFALREFRWKDRDFFNLFKSPDEYKPPLIEPLLKQFPRRRFILVGDSGERDPEIYGALAREFPGQIILICIRDVTGEPADSERYRTAFRELPPDRWQVFRDPAELRF